MLIIHTAFDTTNNAPLVTILFDVESKEFKFYPLYIKSYKQKLLDVDTKIKEIKQIILKHDKVVFNDYKSHQLFFGKITQAFDTLEYNVNELIAKTNNIDKINDILKQSVINTIKNGTFTKWQRIAANAIDEYLCLEKRGVLYSGTHMHPKYELSTFSGRSKTLSFGIQSSNDGDDIQHIDEKFNIFVCIDWISADIRALSLLSNDDNLKNAFLTSNPYAYAAQCLNMSVDETKITLLRDINSLQFNNTKLEQIYPKLYSWSRNAITQLNKDKFLTSILGRKFFINGDNHKTVFNAIAQGSVAHAMHNSISRIGEKFGYNILTELHDAVILCCTKQMLNNILTDVARIMIRPFDSILENNPIFPLRISIGSKWKRWKILKEMKDV